MLTSGELRIGNWLMHVSTHCIVFTEHGIMRQPVSKRDQISFVRVDSLDETRINPYFIEGEIVHDEGLEPIPLTPELLERCGFVKEHDSDIQELDAGRFGMRIQLSTSSVIFRFDAGLSWSDSIDSPEYLHQLQNLFFALTGQELTVNL